MSYMVWERIPPSKISKYNLPPDRYKQLVAPLPLYTIISMGHDTGRGKGWREKDFGVLEGGARCPRSQTAMLQDARETKDYSRQHHNANKHRQRNKGSCKMQKRSSKFTPKKWSYFKKSWAIGKNTVANLIHQSENLGNKNKKIRNQNSLTHLKIRRQPKQ